LPLAICHLPFTIFLFFAQHGYGGLVQAQAIFSIATVASKTL